MQPRFTDNKAATVTSFLRFAEGNEYPQWPLEVFLEVSNICDLQCAMCPTFSALNAERFFVLKREDRGVIAYETATEPLDAVLKHALVIHASGYGEPTIHPQYKELLTYLSGYEALIDFFTNGMHLDQALCDLLVNNRIHRISISFSGASAEEYENIYIGGDFNRVLDGIRRLARTKQAAGSQYPRIEINSIAFKHHIESLPAFVRLMGEAGANTIHIKPLRVYGKNIAELKHHESHLHPGREELILREAKTIATSLGVVLASKPYEATEQHARNFTRAFEAMPDPEREQLLARILAEQVPVSAIKVIALSAEKRREKKEVLDTGRNMKPRQQLGLAESDFIAFKGSPCLEPFKTLHASFDGRVMTCCFASGKDWIGHLDQQSAEQIWNSAAYNTLRDKAANGQYPKTMCGQCLKRGSYPKHHGLQPLFNTYSKWYAEAFGKPFMPDTQTAVMATPDATTIIANLHKRCTRHSDANCPQC